MHKFPQELLSSAKKEDVPIRLSDYVGEKDAIWACLLTKAPDCMLSDLENEGLTIYLKDGEWVIAKLSD